MANVFIDENTLIAIADAIRAKTGNTDKMLPKDMSVAIDGITGGGGGSSNDVRYVTFMNGNTVLYVKPVAVGDDCVNVLTKGFIETPTKESTVDTVYTYSGWSLTDGGSADTTNALANVTEDRTVYASYTESVRYYTVTYYDEDGTTVLHTEQVAYGGSSSYTNKKDNHVFNGWNPEPTNITGDLDCYGAWEESYSFADASWEYIAQVSESGKASEVFALGDTKTETLTYTDGTTEEITLTIVGFDMDAKYDGTGKAGITVVSNVLAEDKQMHSSDTDAYYSDTTLRSYVNTTLRATLPTNLNNNIKQVSKTHWSAASGTNNLKEKTTGEYLWILVSNEVAYTNTTHYPYFDSQAKMIGYKPNGTGAKYWLRRGSGSRGYWTCIGSGGTTGQSSKATIPCGVRFGFCV